MSNPLDRLYHEHCNALPLFIWKGVPINVWCLWKLSKGRRYKNLDLSSNICLFSLTDQYYHHITIIVLVKIIIIMKQVSFFLPPPGHLEWLWTLPACWCVPSFIIIIIIIIISIIIITNIYIMVFADKISKSKWLQATLNGYGHAQLAAPCRALLACWHHCHCKPPKSR